MPNRILTQDIANFFFIFIVLAIIPIADNHFAYYQIAEIWVQKNLRVSQNMGSCGSGGTAD